MATSWGLALGLLQTLSSVAVADPPPRTRAQLICKATSGHGFSYWWAGGAWCANGCNPDFSCGIGSCSPNPGSSGCPDCTHSGATGSDCSGYVGRIWDVPYEKAININWHPYSTWHFYNQSTHWDAIDKGAIEKGDALVYNIDGSGHIVLFESGDPWGYSVIHHAKGCKYLAAKENKFIESKYKARRRHNIIADECTPGQSQSEPCGYCGVRSRSCQGDGSWSDWGACSGQGECAPGATQSEGCGTCGTRSRSCGGDCLWGGWSGCSGEGECWPGALESLACGDCGTTARSCSAGCFWEGWSSCEGPDPDGGKQGCDSGGLGACREGLVRCQQGWLACMPLFEPVAESCDGLDNDCNGQVDDGQPPIVGLPPAFAVELADYSCPAALPAGTRGTVWVDFRNVGSVEWQPGELWLTLEGELTGASPFYLPGEWPAWDVAAVLLNRVAPGEVGRFLFPIRLPAPAGRLRQQLFVLRGPDGIPVRCPDWGFELAVWALPSPALVEEGGKGAGAGELLDSGDALGAEPGGEEEKAEAGRGGCGHAGAAGGGGAAVVLFALLLGVLWLRRWRWEPGGVLLLLVLGCGGGAVGTEEVVGDGLAGRVEAGARAALLAIEPASGSAAGGELVTVTGEGFKKGVRLYLGATELTQVEVEGPERLTARTPRLIAGSYDLTLVLSDGQVAAVLAGAYAARPLELAFVSAPDHLFPPLVELPATSVVAGDFDGDGRDDLLLGSLTGLHFLTGVGKEGFRLDGEPVDEPPERQLPDGRGRDEEIVAQGEDIGKGEEARGEAEEIVGEGDDLGTGLDDSAGGEIELPPEEPALPRFPEGLAGVRTLLAADLDGDGDLDLLAGGDQPLALLLNDGQGRFLAAPEGALPFAPAGSSSLAVADVDGDGRPDLVVGTASSLPGVAGKNRFYLHWAKAKGLFLPQVGGELPLFEERTAAVALADLDGDGRPDLVTAAAEAADGVHLRLLHWREGRFEPAPAGQVPVVAGPLSGLLVADLTGDGAADMVLLSPGGQDRLLVNDGSGFFFDATALAMPLDKGVGSAVCGGDLDLDGRLDLVIANLGQQDRLYLNEGGERLIDNTPLLPIGATSTVGCLLLDGDGDGDLDIITIGAEGEANRLYLSVRPDGGGR